MRCGSKIENDVNAAVGYVKLKRDEMQDNTTCVASLDVLAHWVLLCSNALSINYFILLLWRLAITQNPHTRNLARQALYGLALGIQIQHL